MDEQCKNSLYGPDHTLKFLAYMKASNHSIKGVFCISPNPVIEASVKTQPASTMVKDLEVKPTELKAGHN
jgi:hypothetical protein